MVEVISRVSSKVIINGFRSLGSIDTLLGVSPISTSGQVTDVVRRGFQYAFTAAGVVSLIFLVVGGISIITSQGDPQKMKTGQDTIISGIIGLVFVGIGVLLFNFVVRQLLQIDMSLFDINF